MFTTARVKKLFWSAAACVMLLVASALVAGSGATATANTVLANNCDVIIYEYGHNAPGADTAGNRNAEFIRLVNRGTATVTVEGWWVQDSFPHEFDLKGATLPAGSPFKAADNKFQIPAGASVYVYNGTGTDTNPTNNSAALYRNTQHHFNNSGDTLSLKAADGSTRSYVQYNSYREKVGPLSCPA